MESNVRNLLRRYGIRVLCFREVKDSEIFVVKIYFRESKGHSLIRK